MTALATSPFFTWPVGMASLIATTTVSPRPAYRRLLPPRTRMTSALRAPELSAMRRMLSCWTIWLLRSLDYFSDPPIYRLCQWSRLHNPHGVTSLGTVIVPRLDLLGAGYLLAVHRVSVAAHQGDRDGLLHLVAGDDALTHLATGAGCLGLFGHVEVLSL